jgi:three-Cys-motif partner protein
MKQQLFGGDWTQEKLQCLTKYLHAYTTIFQSNPQARYYTTVYVDAFAGTGSLAPTFSPGKLIPGLVEPDARDYLKGRAMRALEVEPGFHHYLFIERDPERCKELETLRARYPQKAPRIEIRNADANSYLQQWCRNTDWKKTRAVVFLDPFGMQVKWHLMEVIAATQGIDLWILFPLGSAVNRLLTKSEPPEGAWSKTLTDFLGTETWVAEFYPAREVQTLFGPKQEKGRQADLNKIGGFFLKRLKTVFAGVAEKPLVLRNSKNMPIFLFCFAAGNPKGATTGLKIAQQIIGG